MAKVPPGQGTHRGGGGPDPAAPSDTDLGDLGDLGDLVMRVARTIRRRGAEAMAPWRLPPHHARALRVVGRHQPIRPGELAGHLRIAPRSVTDVVDVLEERRLLKRHADPDDRRATVLGLTASGRRLLDEIGAVRRADSDAYFARLSERDRAALGRLLGRLDEEG